MHEAVFLDRDGVINKSVDSRPPNNAAELELLPGVPEAIRRLHQEGFLVFVVTNQGGVALGYMSKEDLAQIHQKMLAQIEAKGGKITEVRACTHRPGSDCSCRKPNPGMLLSLAAKYNLNLKKSYLVGDREVDLQAGKAAGTTTIFISGNSAHPLADYICPDLPAAVEWILSQ
ncbi:MAG: HAD family hydrolase [Firmicutes bacterium]|nr:HAD family hydrolase [Bacillota bacterium]